VSHKCRDIRTQYMIYLYIIYMMYIYNIYAIYLMCHLCRDIYTENVIYMYNMHGTYTGWRRPIGCLKLQAIFRKKATSYKALLREMICKHKASYDPKPPYPVHNMYTIHIRYISCLRNAKYPQLCDMINTNTIHIIYIYTTYI